MEIEETVNEAGEMDEAQAEQPEAAEPEPDCQGGAEEDAAESDAQAEEAGGGESDGEQPETDDADETQAAYERGVLAERERIAGILDIAASVPDKMVRAALFAEPTSAEQLALCAMRAENARRAGYIEQAKADVKASNSADVAAEMTDPLGAIEKDEQKHMLASALNKQFSK